MNLPEAHPPDPGVCSLCGSPLGAEPGRCPQCGLHQAGPGRPSPFDRAALWLLGGVLAGVYVVTLVVVAAAR